MYRNSKVDIRLFSNVEGKETLAADGVAVKELTLTLNFIDGVVTPYDPTILLKRMVERKVWFTSEVGVEVIGHPRFKGVWELMEKIASTYDIKRVTYINDDRYLYTVDGDVPEGQISSDDVFVCPKCGGSRWGTAQNWPDNPTKEQKRDFSKAVGHCNDCTKSRFKWHRESEDMKYFFDRNQLNGVK